MLRRTAVVVFLCLSACRGGPESVADPASVLSRTGQSTERYLDALEAARQRGVDDATKSALRRMVSADGYVVPAREEAFLLLLETDRAALVEALTNALPRMGALEWRKRVCELIAEHRIEELIPALIRAWANPVPGYSDEETRPELLAIERLVGKDRVSDTLLATMRAANPATQANLRARCWELMMRNGGAARLRSLLADPAQVEGDAMLVDLARVARQLGVLPVTREEILWARELCEPTRTAFMDEASAALARMPAERRDSLEIRAVPLAVACARFRPELLDASDAQMDTEIRRAIEGRRKASPDFTGYGSGFGETFYDQREKLNWADRAGMLMAIVVLRDSELVAHLYETADRDLEDRTTEYGGVIALDAGGKPEFLEFAPRAKAGDQRYESPQALFDALYTGLFHVHFHAQKYENEQYAGPHLGDFAFADSTRCNGLVLTFLSPDELGVDFYRHDRMVVDLGAQRRPEG
ncbi:MAG: hypothetical protein ACO3QC_05015 [Phycisphaerales bacterium]